MARTSDGLRYQGVARSAQGGPLAGVTIAVRLSIKDAASNGNTLYSETKNITTNAFGLYSISINDGTGVRTGDFNTVDWSVGARFLQTEIDLTNGTAFVDMGTEQLSNVPVAFIANNLRGVTAPNEGEILEYRNGSWVSKPATRRYNVWGAGYNPGPNLNFIGPFATVVIEKDNPIVTINISKALGSYQPNGALGLHLTLGHKRGNGPVLTFDAIGLSGLRTAPHTRLPFSLSGTYHSDFLAGESVQIGIVGTANFSFSDWNDSGGGMGYVEISY